ncbi:glycosyltransferase [Hungatella hathewayi]|uniref:glycosyltransferase n=1 Tax=Hungatella hathewayi TaxID=154046 RepID=UPI002108AB6E|nr:glycosyltransferase [Hungatella hathewayi]MCQ5386525.1 glycosyltransferase [Hungatella hathewayi]
MDKVLILLSTFNGSDHLQFQLESLQNQRGLDISVLVRDDGSKDSTVEVLNQFHDKMDIQILIEENLGSTKSFLQLLQKCSDEFEYYAFCDQDDFWKPDKLLTAVNKLKMFDSKKPSLYYSGQTLTDANLNPIYEHTLDSSRNILANCIFNQMAGCTAVFNKTLLLKMRSIHQTDKYPGYHDSCLYKVCALTGSNIVYDSKGNIMYRQHEKNVVGLDYSVKGRLNRALDYMKPSELLKDLAYIFDSELLISEGETEEFLWNIYKSNKSLKSKLWLLTHQNRPKFHSLVLRLIFCYKIIFSSF